MIVTKSEVVLHIDNFINDKISQLVYYLNALLKHSVHHTEVDKFIWDCFEEWAQLNITEETPNSAKERVFWHLMHELKLGSLNEVETNLYLASEIETCMDFLQGKGSYPINCIGWRPV